MAAFPDVSKIQYEGPDSKNPLAFRWYNEDEVVEGKTMKEHLRFSVVYWHTFRGTGADPFGAGTMLAPVGRWHRLGRERASTASGSPSSSSRSWARPSTPSTIATSPPKGSTLAETNKNLDAVVKVLKEEQERTGHQAAVGHGQPVQQSALHARRGHQLQRRRLRLRRGAGEEVPGSHQGAGRRELRVLGRPRRLPEPVQHRHASASWTTWPLHAHGRRLRQGDRLHRPVPDRAEAEGADQAPVRLRRRRLHQLPAGLRPDWTTSS